MKLQFSLATLLVCMTVLAVVCAFAAFIPTREAVKPWGPTLAGYFEAKPVYESFTPAGASSRPPLSRAPTGWDIGLRMLLWGPLAIAATVAVLLIVRRLPSRRMVFAVIVLISIPLGWFACQLNWIRQRHVFLKLNVRGCQLPDQIENDVLPWSLRLFGEQSILAFTVYSDADVERAKQLFPESSVFGPTSPKVDTSPKTRSRAIGSRAN